MEQKYTNWKPHETELLSTTLTSKEIARRIGRTEGAVRQRRTLERAVRSRHTFTEEELSLLNSNTSACEIASRTGLTMRAIYKKRYWIKANARNVQIKPPTSITSTFNITCSFGTFNIDLSKYSGAIIGEHGVAFTSK